MEGIKIETKNLPDLYRPYIIYRHTCKITGKVYIGQTCQKPRKRWGSNGINYKSCNLFYNAIKKYGWSNFIHEILYYNLTSEEADKIEKKLIFKNKYIGISYNIATGGAGIHRAVIFKRKIRLSNLNKRTKLVIQINPKTGEIIKEFSSITEAEKYLEISHGHISECCKGKRKIAGGYYWKYKNNTSYDKIWNEVHKKIGKERKVLQIDLKTGKTIMKFSSLAEAEKFTKIPSSNISACCSGKLKTTGGYGWRFVY